MKSFFTLKLYGLLIFFAAHVRKWKFPGSFLAELISFLAISSSFLTTLDFLYNKGYFSLKIASTSWQLSSSVMFSQSLQKIHNQQVMSQLHKCLQLTVNMHNRNHAVFVYISKHVFFLSIYFQLASILWGVGEKKLNLSLPKKKKHISREKKGI